MIKRMQKRGYPKYVYEDTYVRKSHCFSLWNKCLQCGQPHRDSQFPTNLCPGDRCSDRWLVLAAASSQWLNAGIWKIVEKISLADSDFKLHRYFVIVNFSLLTSRTLLCRYKMKVIARKNRLTECRSKKLKAIQKEKDTAHSKRLNNWFITTLCV